MYMQELDLELQQERQKAKEAEALNRKPQACSYCGELGHNRRGCPKLAREQQQEEEKKRREQLGPLWGLAGVEEQRMPGGRQGVLVFPVPFQIEDAVDQVSVATPCAMILTSSSSCFWSDLCVVLSLLCVCGLLCPGTGTPRRRWYTRTDHCACN